MMPKITLSLALLILCCTPAWVVAQAPEVKAIETWSGKLKDDSLRDKFAPTTEFIADAEAWQKLWQAWRAGEEVPEIDFKRNLILVGTAPGPNAANMRPQIDEQGAVKFIVFSTKIGGPGFGYQLMQIDRDGVKSINGHEVNAAAKPTQVKDSITVTVVGTLRTGLVAIGGETTGTTITANDVTWELDFGQKMTFRDAAEKLDGKKVIVTGTLERRQGVEVPQRWIVTVTSLKAVETKADVSATEAKENLSAIFSKKAGQIRFSRHDQTTIIDVTSNTGIGTATIRRLTSAWPKKVLVRLHLSGLESLQASNQGEVFEWSVASGGDHATTATYRSGREQSKLAPPSPYFSEVAIVGGNQTIPLKEGTFDVLLPSPLLADNPEEIKLRWIDFYRN